MAWAAQGSIRGPQGPAADTSSFVTKSETAVEAAANKVVRRTAAGQVTVPATPTAGTDAASKSYTDARIQLVASEDAVGSEAGVLYLVPEEG